MLGKTSVVLPISASIETIPPPNAPLRLWLHHLMNRIHPGNRMAIPPGHYLVSQAVIEPLVINNGISSA